jgi:hypothetical protein
MIERPTITCLKCGYAAIERMPENACLFFYDCKKCGSRLKPKPGDCCVFCSYGSVPSMQNDGSCCAIRAAIMISTKQVRTWSARTHVLTGAF